MKYYMFVGRTSRRVCDKSLCLAVFMPVPHCLQQKGRDGADGSAGISAAAWGRPPALMLH